MAAGGSPRTAEHRASLSTGRVVFLVIAAAAPMAAMVGNVPLALIFGNGAGLPAAYLLAALVLLCFSVGYAAMSRRVVNTGAFYTYIARSLGKPLGVASAYVAVLSYAALTFGLAGGFGYYLVPFLDPSLLTWHQGRPQLYLNVFSREHDSLYVLGFAEFAGAAYRRFDEMAQLVVIDIRARETGVHRAELLALKKDDDPDLRGGIAYLDSPRHASYVDVQTYVSYLADLRDRFGWADVDELTYQPLLRPAGPAPAQPAAGTAS